MNLINQDQTKHFGFIEKSDRFREQAVDEAPIVSAETVAEQIVKPVVKPRKTSNSLEIAIQKDFERFKDIAAKDSLTFKKNISNLEDKLQKAEFHANSLQKEKTALSVGLLSKEKEISELKKKQDSLLSLLEKQEKAAATIAERAQKQAGTSKKVEELEKAIVKSKASFEKQAAVLEQIQGEKKSLLVSLEKARSDEHKQSALVDQVEDEKKNLAAMVSSLTSQVERDQQELDRVKKNVLQNELRYEENFKSLESQHLEIVNQLKCRICELESLAEGASIQHSEMKALLESRVSDLNDSILIAEQRHANLVQSLETRHKEQVDTLKSRISQLAESNSILDEDKSSLQAEITKLKLQLLEATESNRQLTEIKSTDTSTIDELRQQISSLESSAKAASQLFSESKAALESRISELLESNTNLEVDKAALDTRIEELNQLLSLAESAAREASALHADSKTSLEARISELVESNFILDSRNSTLSSQIEALNDELDSRALQLSASETAAQEASRQYSVTTTSLESRISELTESSATLEIARANLETHVAELTRQICLLESAAQEASRLYSESCSTLESRIEELRDQKITLETRISYLEETKLASEQQNVVLVQSLESRQKGLVKELETHISTLEESNSNLEGDISSLVSQVEVLKQELHSKVNQISSLENAAQEFSRQHSEIKSSLESQLESLQRQLDTGVNRISFLETASQEALAQYSEIKSSLESEIKLWKENYSLLESATHEAALNHTVTKSALDSQIESLKQQVTSLDSAAQQDSLEHAEVVCRLQSELETLKQDLANRIEQVSSLEHTVEESSRIQIDLKENILLLESTTSESSDTINKLMIEIETGKNAIDLVNLQNFALKESVELLEQEKLELVESDSNLSSELSAVKLEREELNLKLAEAVLHLTEANQAISRLKEDSSDLKLQVEFHSNLNTEYLQTVDSLKNDEIAAREKMKGLNSRVGELENVVEEREIALNQLSEQRDSTIKELNATTAALGEKDTELRAVQAAHNARLLDFEAEVAGLNDQIKQMTESASTLESNILDLNGRLQESESNLATSQKNLAETRDANKEISDLCSESRREIDDLLNAMDVERKEYRDKFEALTSNNEKLSKNHELLQQKYKDAVIDSSNEIKALQLEVSRVEESRTQFQLDLNESNEKILKLTLENDAIIKEYESKLSVQSATLDSERDSHRDQISLMHSKLLNLTVEAKSLQDRAETLEKDKGKHEALVRMVEMKHASQLQHLESQIKSLELQLQNQVELVESKDLELKDLLFIKHERNQMSHDLDITKQENYVLDRKIHEMQNSESLERRSMRSQLESKLNEISILKGDRDRAKKEYNDALKKKEKQIQDALNEARLAKAKEDFVTSELLKATQEQSGQIGHNNAKQKIKLFSQLKEENVKMKKELEADKLSKDDLRRKVSTLERELEGLKALGVVGKPMSRAQRAFRNLNVDDGEEKEN